MYVQVGALTRPTWLRTCIYTNLCTEVSCVALFSAPIMNSSDSDDDSYNERSALVPSQNPAVPSYRPTFDPRPPIAQPCKQVSIY